MGDFDRNEKPSQAGETKKLVMVVILGAGLLCVVGYQMMKHGPQPAVAGVVAGAAADLPSVTESPESLRIALKSDPTELLLRTDTVAASTGKIRNPFRMGAPWLSSLYRAPAPQVVNRDPVRPPVIQAVRPVEPVQPLGLRAEDYKLGFIMNSSAASINNKVVSTGSIVGKARVVEIRDDHVTLQHMDYPDGPQLILTMQRR